MAALTVRQEPEQVGQPEAAELSGEDDRPRAPDVPVVAARGDVEMDAASPERRRLALGEQRRIVLPELGGGRAHKRAVPEDGCEVALPGAERAEDAWMAEPDVDRSEAAGAEPFERPASLRDP